MDDVTPPPVSEPRRKRSRFGARLIAACFGAALLPILLVALAVNGFGAQKTYWAATAVALVLLGTWPFAARHKAAGLEKSAVLMLGILAALLISFFAGSVLATVGVNLWQPEIRVGLPQAGA